MEPPAYREHELAFRTQYAELKERTLAAGALLPGTPGSLALRSGTGYGYWYRVFYPVPSKPAEELACKEGDAAVLEAMRSRMAFAEWASAQVSALRKLGFQVADKATARVLVELHNRQAFGAGLVLTGTLACMAWLNELGSIAVTARTLDIDLARRQQLKLGAPLPFQWVEFYSGGRQDPAMKGHSSARTIGPLKTDCGLLTSSLPLAVHSVCCRSTSD